MKLEISDIRFVADQAVVLPEEKPRLEAVARALKKIQGRTFRVIGHTARAGTEAGQRALSVERARAVVDFLVASGLDAGRFVYEGRGASEPVASNDTPRAWRSTGASRSSSSKTDRRRPRAGPRRVPRRGVRPGGRGRGDPATRA